MFDGYHFSATVDSVTLAGSTAKTLLQLTAGSSHRPQVTGISVSLDGATAANAAALVQLVRQTTAGTMSAGTEVSLSDTSFNSAASVTHTATGTEPTTGDVLFSYFVPQYHGLLVLQFPPGEEIQLGVSERFGIVVTSPNAVDASANLIWKD